MFLWVTVNNNLLGARFYWIQFTPRPISVVLLTDAQLNITWKYIKIVPPSMQQPLIADVFVQVSLLFSVWEGT